MRDILTLFLHTIVTIIRLAQPGGLRTVVAESVLMRHQVLILNRGRKRLRTFAPPIASSSRDGGAKKALTDDRETLTAQDYRLRHHLRLETMEKFFHGAEIGRAHV